MERVAHFDNNEALMWKLRVDRQWRSRSDKHFEFALAEQETWQRDPMEDNAIEGTEVDGLVA
jgi:hypothetical protein